MSDCITAMQQTILKVPSDAASFSKVLIGNFCIIVQPVGCVLLMLELSNLTHTLCTFFYIRGFCDEVFVLSRVIFQELETHLDLLLLKSQRCQLSCLL